MKFNHTAQISVKATIGANVKIGDRTIIYDNVVVGDNSIISNDCIIGEPSSDYYYNEDYQNPITIIGNNALIRSHAIIYSSSKIGNDFSTGHRVTIREKSIFGDSCKVGTLCDIQGEVTFGNCCWLHSSVHIGQKSIIGNYVFIYPYVVLTNDPLPPSEYCIGPTIGDFSVISTGSVILPGILIGKHCLIAANSVVAMNIEEYSIVSGNPAKFISDIRRLESKETGEEYYPWPNNFSRGMPWQGIGYKQWQELNNRDKV